MRQEVVCLDIEATGLDFENDRIIEIAAVRFNEHQILDEFHTLIDPGIPIPDRIVELTGITDSDVAGKPSIHHVIREFTDFIGNTPLMGHKVSTDVAFLRPLGIAHDNPLIDTYELAAFLMPTATRYNLSSLVEQLGLSDLNAHRALDDTYATIEVYRVLWKKLLELPLPLLKEIADASTDLDWGAKLPLLEALNMRLAEGNEGAASLYLPFTPSNAEDWHTLQPKSPPKEINTEQLTSLIGPSGKLSQCIEDYESRASQETMLHEIAEAFNYRYHLIVEAPTGTGKSIAYLIPAIYWALENNARVVISTATIALQDQLIEKDIPLLKKALGIEFEATVAKGRSHYLCPRQLEAMRRRRPTSVDELRVFAKVLTWLQTSNKGERSELNLRDFAEEMAWLKLSAQDEGCTLQRCEKQMQGACPFFKARRQAETAHIIVANHALTLSDVQVGNRVLPEYQYIIIDEAHQLEDATTRGLQIKLDRITMQRRFTDLYDNKRGFFFELLENLKGNIPTKHYAQLEPFFLAVAESMREMSQFIDYFFETLLNFLLHSGTLNDEEYASFVRITPDILKAPHWEHVKRAWSALDKFFHTLASSLERANTIINKYNAEQIPNYDDLTNTLQAAINHLEETQQVLAQFISEPDPNVIYWAEVNPNNTYVSVNAAPLHVGPLIEEHLWNAKSTVILTSATLTTDNSFKYIRERLNAREEKVATVVVPTPFDYKNTTLIYIPTDIPEPNMREQYQLMLERGIIETATAVGGRTLGLFTSYSQLRQTAQNIAPRLALGGISVLDQASGSSNQTLVENFKSTEKAVLLGTRSFWEGIDLPGDDLQVLIIARLPFTVPSDPIFAARSETFDNSFMQYAVPDAILRFRQGFGRLIRRRTDRGVVAVFDKRIISKRYGQMFLNSLPDCTVVRGPLSKLAQTAKQWIEKG